MMKANKQVDGEDEDEETEAKQRTRIRRSRLRTNRGCKRFKICLIAEPETRGAVQQSFLGTVFNRVEHSNPFVYLYIFIYSYILYTRRKWYLFHTPTAVTLPTSSKLSLE